jgi:uncharacterized phage protein (TIGR02218 family)
MMRTATGSFPFTATSVLLADLWTFTLANGTVYRWTSYETALTYGSTWSVGPIIKRESARLIAGLEVDSLTLTVETGETVMLGARLFSQAAAAKALDGCFIKLERAYMVLPGVVQCTVHLFEGLVAEVEPSHAEVRIRVTSYTERLNQSWPRNYWSPQCQHKLYSTGCGVSELANQITVNASGDQFGFTAAHAKPDGWFNLGKATFVGGLNDGIMMGIKSQTGSSFTLVGKLPAAVSGTVLLVPGCDKLKATCETKFGNLPRFKGAPYVPKPETAR